VGLDSVVEHQHLQQVVLVAHDASGPLAIDWALAHADRVAALVLLNTYYCAIPTLQPPEAIRLFSTPLVRNVARAVSQAFFILFAPYALLLPTLLTGDRDVLNHWGNLGCQQIESFRTGHIWHDHVVESFGSQVRETINSRLRAEGAFSAIAGNIHEIGKGLFDLLVGAAQFLAVSTQDFQLLLPRIFV